MAVCRRKYKAWIRTGSVEESSSDRAGICNISGAALGFTGFIARICLPNAHGQNQKELTFPDESISRQATVQTFVIGFSAEGRERFHAVLD
jgi:hypothetical protein